MPRLPLLGCSQCLARVVYRLASHICCTHRRTLPFVCIPDVCCDTVNMHRKPDPKPANAFLDDQFKSDEMDQPLPDAAKSHSSDREEPHAMFDPPLSRQRYARVAEILRSEKVKRVCSSVVNRDVTAVTPQMTSPPIQFPCKDADPNPKCQVGWHLKTTFLHIFSPLAVIPSFHIQLCM